MRCSHVFLRPAPKLFPREVVAPNSPARIFDPCENHASPYDTPRVGSAVFQRPRGLRGGSCAKWSAKLDGCSSPGSGDKNADEAPRTFIFHDQAMQGFTSSTLLFVPLDTSRDSWHAFVSLSATCSNSGKLGHGSTFQGNKIRERAILCLVPTPWAICQSPGFGLERSPMFSERTAL